MKNVDVRVEKKKLIIEIDLTKDFGASKSGKTTMIATTEGNFKVPGTDDVVLGLNAYKPRKEK